MTTFTGTTGNDVQDGTSLDDTFIYSQGGRDRLNGLDGDDTFKMGASLTAADRINGGDFRTDTVVLNGDYNLVLGANTLVNIEELKFQAGHDYNITINDAMAVLNPNVPFFVRASLTSS